MGLLLPTAADAEELLSWAGALNPGLWVAHSKTAARAAKTVAERCRLDPDAAYVMGLLHDIGRFEGVTELRHVTAGYRLMLDKGYADAARICLTHSFPIKEAAAYSGENDLTDADFEFLKQELARAEYDGYDKLIQLADAISAPNGVVPLELRLFDVAKRRGINNYTVQKWQAFAALKDYFADKCKTPVYSLFLEDIIKNFN